jgi:hypothetical protein
MAQTDTFDFQAKDFYLKQGYKVFGESKFEEVVCIFSSFKNASVLHQTSGGGFGFAAG